jgi:uncharacterized protein YecE (DUF72 family)
VTHRRGRQWPVASWSALPWTDKSLIDCRCFYPPEAKTPEDRLRFYASRFPIVEVDSTFYGLPSEQNAALWVERTPPDFTFDIKAFRLFTVHQTPPGSPKDLRGVGAAFNAESHYRGMCAMRCGIALGFTSTVRKLGPSFPPWLLPGSQARRHTEAGTASSTGSPSSSATRAGLGGETHPDFL